MKRALDLLFSIAGLIVLSPLLALIAVLIKIDTRGPVFFTHPRIGRGFKPFCLYKFRSMTEGAHLEGPRITAGGDPRVTPFGRFLRRTKLDELPQLLNVVKGDMSLVGPRPEVSKYVELFRADYEEILRVRPGITDPASLAYRNEEEVLSGRPDAEKHYVDVVLPDKIRLSKEYVCRKSTLIDLRLVLRTLGKVPRMFR